MSVPAPTPPPPGRRFVEYALDGAALGIFMLSAMFFATLLEHPASPARAALPDPGLRRGLMGLAMGSTAVALIYSPWGKRSGAHLNPATTLAFWRLGKVPGADFLGYTIAQFAGGAAGAALAVALAGAWVSHPSVHFVATRPGMAGLAVAFAAELTITALLVSVILRVIARPRLEPYAGVFAGLLVATYIAFEAPLSGMSMNPARTFGSAVVAGDYTALWIYFTAPPLGALLAAEAWRLESARRAPGRPAPGCAKLRHDRAYPCVFCGHAPLPRGVAVAPGRRAFAGARPAGVRKGSPAPAPTAPRSHRPAR